MGYYAGIVPRLLANVATIVMVGGSTYIINKYIIRDREISGFTGSIMAVSVLSNIISFLPRLSFFYFQVLEYISFTFQFICSTMTYPFHVVSHCMAVNNCG